MIDIDDHLKGMKDFQDYIIQFIDNENEDESHYNQIIELIKNSKLIEDSLTMESLLYLIVKITNNFHYSPKLISKIENILLFLKDDIIKALSSKKIFNIFNENKRLLLFCIENKLITIDQAFTFIVYDSKCFDSNYPSYFYPELNDFCHQKSNLIYLHDFRLEIKANIEADLKNDFFKKRKEGQNDSYLCSLIREDDLNAFIYYINTNDIPFSSKINKSIYETNQYLAFQQPTLIEYAAFFGSIQIFKYLILNKVKIDKSLCLYAIHSKNSEIIHILEDKCLNIIEQNYESLIIESIKCHHNDITEYFINNYASEEIISRICTNYIKYYNYYYIDKEINNEQFFFDLCKYDNTKLVSLLINSNHNIDVNLIVILKSIFVMKFNIFT